MNSMQYDGRLLPPWYDEGFAAVIENRLHGLNAVFCRARATTPGGTVARGTTWSFDPKLLRTGRWREILGKALDDNAVRDFDRLARKEFHDLDLIDTVVAMGIIEWVVAKGDITEFHKVIRETAPEVLKRVIDTVAERKEVYDKAFRAATKLDMRAADKAWRDWFKKSGRKGPGAEDEGGRVG